MSFRDLDEFLTVEPIVLPIRGKEYRFPGSVSARVWLQLQALSEQMQQAKRAATRGDDFEPDAEALSDMDEAAMMAEMLGGVQAEMVEDGLTSAHIRAAFHTLIAWHLSGQEAAEAVWAAQGKAPAPDPAARRAKPAGRSAPRGSHAPSSCQAPDETTSPGGGSSNTGG
jgi:hypothetical protein